LFKNDEKRPILNIEIMQVNQRVRIFILLTFWNVLFQFSMIQYVHAACANIRIWVPNAGTTTWTTNANWNPTNPPNTATETAYIVSDWRIPQFPSANYTLSCLEIASGSMTAPATSNTLTIVDDYFRNLNTGSIALPGGSNFQVIMQGTSDQTFENVDPIPRLNINNPTTVTLTHPFIVTNDFSITSGTGNVVISGNLVTQQTGAITIPSSATVTISSGVQWAVNGNLTIDGILKLMPGASLRMANGRVLSVGATGTLQLIGSSGNAAIIDAVDTSSTYSMTIAGQIDADYFSIGRMTAAGMNVTGQILDLSNGSFNYIPNGGYGLTLGAASSVSSSTLNKIGFYGQSATTPRNVNATSYTGSIVTFDNWQGVGGTPNETDPTNKITWANEAATELLLTDSSVSGVPPTTIASGAGYTQFATFAFALSKADTASDITSITFTIDGSYNTSDITGVQVFRDNNNNCVYNAGTDSQVGGTYNPSGSPAKFTVTFATGNLQPSNSTGRCVHVLMSIAANAQVNNTVGIKIASTDHIINSQNYPLSATNSPPLSTGVATITGGTLYKWNGGNGNNMNTAGNWTPGTVPNSTRDCEIGAAYDEPRMAGAFACKNMNWLPSGSIEWNNSTNIFSVYGALTVGSTFGYTTTTTGAIVRFIGTAAQAVNMNGNVFPGSVQVNNTTGPVTFESDGTINGSLTLNNGVTRIVDGATLTVLGNVIVTTGATLDIEPGGTLVLGNGDTLTVNAGGTLELLGSTGKTADIRAQNNASSYTITINGTISARYYSIRNLGTNGLTINAAATIDPTNHLQNGSYTYPGANAARLLRLFRQVPTNNLDTMTFDTSGSAATGVKSISTNTTAGTVTITNYSGSITGAANSENVNYLVSWVSLTNTIDLTQEATAPASVNQGDIVNLGRFGFKQTTGGAFSDSDITYMRLTLIGTGSAADIDSIALYFDSACSGSGGTLVGSTTFSGSPARAEFSGISGATIPFHATTPPKRCFYAVASVSAAATNGATIGIKIDLSAHVTNSQNYAFNGSASPPVDVGTSTIVGSSTYWTGAVSTAWNTAGNWNGGVPTSTINCFINSAVRNPIITTAAVCKSVTIGTGNLTINNPGDLSVYGSFANSGTFTQNSRPLILRDNGVTPVSQSISSSTMLDSLQFNKTAGGSVTIDSSTLNVNSALSMVGGSNFNLIIPPNKTLSTTGGFTLTAGSLTIQSGGILEIGSGQTFTLNGGSLITTGTNDAYPQSLSTKGKITRRGASGTWNFTATSGTINLVGFVMEWLGTAGLNIGGSTNVTQINGGQLRSLPSTAGMRAIQLNTTGALPATISNFGWYWGSGNSVPSQATSYFLGYSSGCSNRTVSFDQWFGDFWPFTTTNTDAKISETNCNIVIDRANSPVSLTEFKATAYDGKVVLEWTTGLEWYHKGFNVYRSTSPETGFIQLNSEMIRNDLFTTNIHGSYAFIDEDAPNGMTYYYKLEDISSTEDRTLHGPVAATPNGAYGNPPPPLASTIVSSNPSGSQSSGGNGASPTTPEMINLEPNVDLISKTENAIRLKITIPAYTLTPDATHNSYQHLSIPLYTKTLTAGHPELLARTLMLKVGSSTASATFEIVSEQSATNSVLVAPAPDWVVVGNQYQSQWSLNASAYAQTNAVPTAPISVGSVVTNDGNTYLPLTVHPVAYTSSSQDLKKYNEIVVDVFLNGATTWKPNTPISVSEVWGAPGSLRIGISGDGMYEVSYDDMLSAGVVAPFHLADVTQLKLFVLNQEHPLDIKSVNGHFSTGDSIRFYARNSETLDSKTSYVLLVYDYASMIPGIRMNSVDVSNSSGLANSQAGTQRRVRLEENNIAVFNEPYDQNMDLFVWGMYYKEAGGASTSLVTDVELPYLISSQPVTIHVLAKTRTTNAVNYQSNMDLLINDKVVPGGNISFPGGEVQILSFTIDGTYFAPGKNKLTLSPTAAHLIAGEYDMVYIDYIDVYYNQDWFVTQDQVLVQNTQPTSDILIDGFTDVPNSIYDISQFGVVDKWINASVVPSADYSVAFNTPADPSKGRRVWVSTDAEMLQPGSLELVYGSDLIDTANQADVLYIGSPELLEAVGALAQHREAAGFKTQRVSLKSIYNEFGQGIVSTDAIRAFLIYASENWTRKPKYVVFLGDGTYDPKGYQNAIPQNHFPVKLISGAAFNYGSDHWFVTKPENNIPFAVVGRIPARTNVELRAYVQKVLDYENGISAPQAAQFTLLSDKAHYTGENFDGFSSTLKTNIQSWSNSSNIQLLSRTQMGDDTFKTQLNAAFNSASVIHYMGHGAENMWADNFIFTNNDVDVLANTKLPVVVAMNCLNANFYDPDMPSLAEKLVMKPSGGAIVFWGSTSMTPPSVQSIYQNAFYEQLLKTRSSVGDTIKLSKQQAYTQSPYDEALLSWTIIGDPMVSAVLPAVASTPAPAANPASAASGASKGCSAFGGFTSGAQTVPYDMIFAFLLEVLLSLALLRFSYYIVRKTR
jgi:hypothetical protein